MRRALLCSALAVAAFFAAPAFAAPVTVSWAYSATCADGTAASNCPVTNVQLNQKASPTGAVVKSTTVPSSQKSAAFDLPPGPVCFTAIALAGTVPSDESVAACATIPSSKPGVIVITVTVQGVATVSVSQSP